MEKSRPILSICIPTYNRADYLKKSLDSIVNQDEFTDEVEIVISDNASTDSTQEIAETYCEKYKNIKYFRNEENILAKNHPLALQRATGSLRKLSNDTLVYESGSLKYILDAIYNNKINKPVLFFIPLGEQEEEYHAKDMDSFVNFVSYYITWIACFTFWDNDCEDMETYYKDIPSHIPQVAYLLQCMERGREAVVYNKKIITTQPVERKDLSYGLFGVFYTNLLERFVSYVNRGLISKGTYEKIKKDLLLNFFSNWIVEFRIHPKLYIEGNEELGKCIRDTYKNESYYGLYKWEVFIRLIKGRLRNIKTLFEKGYSKQ